MHKLFAVRPLHSQVGITCHDLIKSSIRFRASRFRTVGKATCAAVNAHAMQHNSFADLALVILVPPVSTAGNFQFHLIITFFVQHELIRDPYLPKRQQ
jgi:hypothetical protein